MGDYEKRLTLNGSGGLYQLELSKEYSINGDYSAKTIFTGAGYVRYRSYEVSELINKTVTFQGHVKTDKQLEWRMYCQIGSNYTSSTIVSIPSGEGLFKVSMTIPENTSNILFSLDSKISGDPCSCYTDNWTASIQ